MFRRIGRNDRPHIGQILRAAVWTNEWHEAEPLGRFGPDTATSCASSAQFRYDAEADASAAT